MQISITFLFFLVVTYNHNGAVKSLLVTGSRHQQRTDVKALLKMIESLKGNVRRLEQQYGPCRNFVCFHGGFCRHQNGVPFCQCKSKYFGPRCNLREPPACNRELFGEQGTISSVGFPYAYPRNSDCTYRIRTTPGKVIVLSFISISIKRSRKCSKDFVEIYDGPSTNFVSIGKFCGHKNPGKIVSSTSDVLIKFKTDATDNIGSGFALFYFSKQPEVCGGSLTEDAGIITSPKWPAAYKLPSTCRWVISVPKNEHILYKISQLVLAGSLSACNSYLELHDGPDDRSPIIGKFCSNTILSQPPTSSNQLYVKFVTDGAGSLLKMKYSTPCGGVLNSTSGTIQSPYFPNSYPNKKTCVWTLNVPANNVITVNFTIFDIESSDNCIYDYVTVYNGPSLNDPILGRFCGTTTPKSLTSSMNQLTLVFKSDAGKTSRGFKATYTSSPGGCGGIVTGLTGSISSPKKGPYYPNNIRCVWTIKSSKISRSVQLYFSSFHLQHDSACANDYILFRNGSLPNSPILLSNTQSGRFCGSATPPVVTSTHESLTVVFHTDAKKSSSGFLAVWTTVPRTAGCDVYLATPFGSIQSPSYPDIYPRSQLCKYTISVEKGLKIELVFQDFLLEHRQRCDYDNLKIYDGKNNKSALIGSFCGSRSPRRIVSTSNAMHLVFKSDFSNSARGFFANYTTGRSLCGGMLFASSGVIQSPNYPKPYNNDTVCTWVITTLQGNTIDLKVDDIDTETSAACQYYDKIEVRDGANDSADVITRICGKVPIKRTFKSTGRFMFIRFTSDSSINGRGFRLRYSAGCGGVFKDFKGTFQSPNYPNTYPTMRACKYKFIGKTGFLGRNIVRINFTDFQLENSTDCRHDYVNVYNGMSKEAPLLGKYCGARPAFSVVSTASNIFMIFSSDKNKAFKGFSAMYEIIGCGGVFTAPNGSISSPNYPSHYPNDIVCKWRIKVASGSRIQLNFTEIDLERVSCLYDYIDIFDGSDEVAPIMGKYCVKHGPLTVTSSTNQLMIKFTSDYSKTARGFHLNYNTIKEVCGGLFTFPHGIIQSPGYPEAYPLNTECKWIIAVESGLHIRINFTDFHLESESSCEYDYLQILDGNGKNASELAKNCDTASPGLQTSTRNVLVLKFRSDGSNVERGFIANYSTGCGGKINADKAGILSSPNYANFYPHYTDCVWILQGKVGRNITLTFTDFDLEFHATCDKDFVEIRDGNMSSSPLVGTFCGTTLPNVVRSSSNSLYVKFHSNYAISRKGFRAQYTTSAAVCGGILNALRGVISSPLYPERTPAVSDCFWKMKVAPGSVIVLAFTSLNIVKSESCNSAYVAVHDGPSSESKLIGRYCGTSSPQSITTTTNNIYIRFHHDNIKRSKGFKANFKAVCNNTITSSNGFIASPNWPSLYPNTEIYPQLEVCVWKLKLPPGKQIRVKFIEFDFEESNDCYADALELRNGGSSNSTLIGKYCGSNLPLEFTSSSNLLWVKFSSDHNFAGQGFKLLYEEEAKN